MKKTVSFILTFTLLAFSACSFSEYIRYRLSVGDPLNAARDLYPLDANNVIVTCRPYDHTSWHVTWYRNGVEYRDISGLYGDRIDLDLRMPKPAGWDGETLTLYYAERIGELKTIRHEYYEEADPDNYVTYTALWTESGLEQLQELTQPWNKLFCSGQVALYSGENGWTVRYNGQDNILPDSFPAGTWFVDCVPAGKDSFLLKFRDGDTGTLYAAYVDDGQEKYRVELPLDEAAPGRLFSPDREGGFLYRNGKNTGDYSPVNLVHYDQEGRYDRTVALTGDRVVIRPYAAAMDPDEGLCTLYGSLVANSRKIYTVFALTLNSDLQVIRQDIRKIDPEYGDYEPMIYLTPDGTAYVSFCEVRSGDASWQGLSPVMIPFSQLEKTDKTYGLKLSQ